MNRETRGDSELSMSRYLFIKCFEKAIIMQKTWSDTLLTALPINVALKKITNWT